MAKNITPAASKLQVSDQNYLKTIGLSKAAIQLYDLLLEHGPLSAQAAADQTGAFPAAEYRLFYELEGCELVRRLAGRPRRFEALALSDGLQASLLNREKQLKQLLHHPHVETGEQASILVGRQKVYDAYVAYAKKAKTQICIYAIGIAYTPEIAKTQAGAVKRGVTIRHVVQELKAANYYVISRWLKLGIALRTLKRPRGYHLTIIDDSCAIVTFSNPVDTEQRISLLTTDKNTIAIFQAQFDAVWQSAKSLAP